MGSGVNLRVGDTSHGSVETQVASDNVTVRIGDLTHQVRVQRLPDGALLLTLGDRQFRAWSDGEWAVVDGRARLVRPEAERAGGTVIGEITPPMPSVVVSVLVAVGDTVAVGQRLVTVSAMKTETALRAPRAGRVTAIRVVPGQSVRPGDRLVEIE